MTTTWVDNLKDDFGILFNWDAEKVTALATFLTAIAIATGVVIAQRQLKSWRTERVGMRSAEVAEELIARALDVEDALKHVRNPMDQIPKDKLNDKVYPYQRRYDRLMTYNELFKDLRSAQIRVRAVIGDQEVDNAVETLFKVRNRILIAIDMLADFARDGTHENDRPLKRELRADLYGSGVTKNPLGQEFAGAVHLIEHKLKPFVRLEKH